MRGLASDLLQIVRNDQWHPQIRLHALSAYCKQADGDGQAAKDLTVLLEDVGNGTVYDGDDELLGLLLDSLYPSILRATDIVRFLRAPKSCKALRPVQEILVRAPFEGIDYTSRSGSFSMLCTPRCRKLQQGLRVTKWIEKS